MNLDAVSGFVSHFPTDWVIILVFAVLVAGDTVRAGSARASALALSLPATLLIISTIPNAKMLSGVAGQFSSPVPKAVLFGIVFAIAYILVRRMSASYSSNTGEIIQSVLAGAAASFVAVVVWLQVPELQAIWSFGPQVQAVFGEAYRFWWIVGSYVALGFARG